jgi:preprotein translocase subunit SecD
VLAGLLPFSAVLAAEPGQISLEVASASAIHDMRGQRVVSVVLSLESRRTFAAYTSEYVGRFFEFRLPDQVPMKIRIVDPISGGIMHIPGGENDDAAVGLARRLSSPGTRIEVRVLDR